MDAIPDDIQKTAFQAAIRWLQHEKAFGKHAQSLTDAMGRAIWAERERCAKVCEAMTWFRLETPKHVISNGPDDFAAAIRSEPPLPTLVDADGK